MTDPTMIERVARILTKNIVTSEYSGVPANATDKERTAFWALFMEEAREIVAALREPTEAMTEAIIDVAPDRPHADYWQAGIDAVLAEN